MTGPRGPERSRRRRRRRSEGGEDSRGDRASSGPSDRGVARARRRSLRAARRRAHDQDQAERCHALTRSLRPRARRAVHASRRRRAARRARAADSARACSLGGTARREDDVGPWVERTTAASRRHAATTPSSPPPLRSRGRVTLRRAIAAPRQSASPVALHVGKKVAPQLGVSELPQDAVADVVVHV